MPFAGSLPTSLPPSFSPSVATINLSPPEPVLDARHLDELIGLWLERGVADPRTAAGYGYKVKYFRTGGAANGPGRGWALRRRHLLAFAKYLETVRSRYGEPLSYHSQNDVLRRLRQMFAWASLGGFLPSGDFAAWVPSPDGEPPERQAATVEMLQRLFEAADRVLYPERARTILAVLIGTGIRRGECASIRVEDIRLYADHSGTMTVTGKRTRANHTGRRQVAFDTDTGAYLAAFFYVNKIERGPLFRNLRTGEGLTIKGVHHIVKGCIAAAGLTEQIQGCHDLRRAFATHFARMFRGEGYGDLLRRQMGHRTYRMTAQYSLLNADDIRDSLKSPLHFFDAV